MFEICSTPVNGNSRSSEPGSWKPKDITSEIVPLSLKECGDKFLEDAKARGLREASLYKYRLVLKQLQAFGEKAGVVFIAGFGVEELRGFRVSWTEQELVSAKETGAFESVLPLSRHDSDWVKDNPGFGDQATEGGRSTRAAVLRRRDEEGSQSMRRHSSPQRALQLRALVLLMRHSGLRIGDACTLSRDRINGALLGKLYTAKSGTKVRVPLNPVALNTLKKVPRTGRPLLLERGIEAADVHRRVGANLPEDV